MGAHKPHWGWLVLVGLSVACCSCSRRQTRDDGTDYSCVIEMAKERAGRPGDLAKAAPPLVIPGAVSQPTDIARVAAVTPPPAPDPAPPPALASYVRPMGPLSVAPQPLAEAAPTAPPQVQAQPPAQLLPAPAATLAPPVKALPTAQVLPEQPAPAPAPVEALPTAQVLPEQPVAAPPPAVGISVLTTKPPEDPFAPAGAPMPILTLPAASPATVPLDGAPSLITPPLQAPTSSPPWPSVRLDAASSAVPLPPARPAGVIQATAVAEAPLQPAVERLRPEPPAERLRPEPGPAGSLRAMYRLAADKYATVDSYVLRLRRREQVNGKNRPEEVILLKFRKNPWSVYLKWLAGEGKEREVVYVRGKFGDKIHTLMAAGDSPFMAITGKRISLPPDSPMIRNQTRHGINEAGIGPLIDRFGVLVEAAERGDTRVGTLKYLTTVKRSEFEGQQLEAALQIVPPGAEPGLPRGGQRWWFFDVNMRFPVLIITHDDKGQEVEYYCHDRFFFPGGKLDDDEFNPDVLWRGK